MTTTTMALADAPRVEIATDIVNGAITVDKPEASPGETVTITVTSSYGYAAMSSNVTIELTIDLGHSLAPRLIPAPSETFHPTGDARATHDMPGTYTLTMPDNPFYMLSTTQPGTPELLFSAVILKLFGQKFCHLNKSDYLCTAFLTEIR